MTKIEWITFDCAGTLVEARWTADGFLCDCMAHLGMPLDLTESNAYARMFRERQADFLLANQTRDPDQVHAFWRRLGFDWLGAVGRDPSLVGRLERTADELGFGAGSILFSAYDDALPVLDALADRGIRTAVISNWDISLHRVLSMFGMDRRLERAFASLEEGVEKPDPRLFEIALAALDTTPDRVLHVGDDPVDDLQGAAAAGIRALLIDRTSIHPVPPTIASLMDVLKAVEWTG